MTNLLPCDRDELRERWNEGERFDFYLFYGHQPPHDGSIDASCLSQWYSRSFEVDGVQYATAEHWMMAEKARLFGDQEATREIIDCPTPRDAKSIGRRVRGFEAGIWDQHKFEIVCAGNRAKFGQNDDLKTFLLSTASQGADTQIAWGKVAEKPAGYDVTSDNEVIGDDEPDVLRFSDGLVPDTSARVILVEAAGRDVIWGIGLGKSNPKSRNPMLWRGRNLLGFALTKVRDEFLSSPT